MVLPLSGFTAIPNPYMIPFMGFQSYVIGAMFGMAYQGYKRRISSMSNEDFNKLDLSTFGMDEMRKLTANTPRMEQMFAEMRPMVDIMAKELGNLLRSIPDLIGSVTGEPSVDSTNPSRGIPGGVAGFLRPIVNVPIPNPENLLPPSPPLIPRAPSVDPFIGPPAPALTQQQLLDKYANWETYRSKGGLLTEQRWRLARRGEPGGLPPAQIQPRGTILDTPGRQYHPQYFRQLKSLQNNRNTLVVQLNLNVKLETKIFDKFQQMLKTVGRTNSTVIRLGTQLANIRRTGTNIKAQINRIQKEMEEFVRRFKPTK